MVSPYIIPKNLSSKNLFFFKHLRFPSSLFLSLLFFYTKPKDFSLTFHIVLFSISQNKEESSFFFTKISIQTLNASIANPPCGYDPS